ncbi:PRTRC system protein E [Deinococcus sp. SL84]|uniref:PRTRC system protein E n=1 Tax=Deinococcus sp. SL84 TaxID=2994663 RepID=UPI0022730FA9|nr:PRTRC system protein E [Deinococcus sp. SL84]MCY1703795.1 PRTRC system protein E [Deinococcus sp. SL84]
MTEPAKHIRSHAEIWADLQAETILLKERDAAVFEANIAPLYKQHSRAQSDAAEAQLLLDKLKSFSQGGALAMPPKAASTAENVPFTPATQPDPVQPEPGPVQPAPQAPPEPAVPQEAPAEETDANEENSSTEKENTEAGTTEAEAEPAAPATVASFQAADGLVEPDWANGDAIGSGWLSQLAATLGDGDSLLFAVSRVGEQLRVVIQPRALTGETNTAVPLESLGLPSELDSTLIQDLLAYREGRSVARQTVSYLEQVRANAEQARKDATKKKPAASANTKPAAKPTSGKVVLTTIPAGAALMTFGPDGKKVELQPGMQRELPPGKYTSKASYPGHVSAEQSFEVKAGAEQVLEIRLKAEMENLFS